MELENTMENDYLSTNTFDYAFSIAPYLILFVIILLRGVLVSIPCRCIIILTKLIIKGHNKRP